MSILYILGGLPGTGKSTIARVLSERIGATWLRIDTIEHALAEFGIPPDRICGKGYQLAGAIAADNLRCGRDVIADSVNPVTASRHAWRRIASDSQQGFMEIEVFCSDLAEHECRVRERLPEISGFRLPSWKDVIDREYEQWPEAKLRIDTTRLSPKEAVDIILQKQQQFDLTK